MTAETPPPVYDDRSEASGLDNSPVGVPGSFIGSSGECVPVSTLSTLVDSQLRTTVWT